MFPRSYERGSIEASPHRLPKTARWRCFHVHMNVALLKRVPGDLKHIADGEFPRSYERGSIEAAHQVPTRLRLAAFPRSYERGSIEASCRPNKCTRRRTCFHVHMNVALLKR